MSQISTTMLYLKFSGNHFNIRASLSPSFLCRLQLSSNKWKFDFIFHEKTYIVQAFPDPAILDGRCSNDYTEIIGRYLS